LLKSGDVLIGSPPLLLHYARIRKKPAHVRRENFEGGISRGKEARLWSIYRVRTGSGPV